MSKQIYIDSNGNEVLISGTVNSADMLPVEAGSGTDTKAYVDGLIKYTTKNANIVSTQAYSDFRYDDVSFSEIDRSKVIGITVIGGPTNRPAFAILMDGSVTKVRVFANGYADGTSIPVRLAYLDN